MPDKVVSSNKVRDQRKKWPPAYFNETHQMWIGLLKVSVTTTVHQRSES